MKQTKPIHLSSEKFCLYENPDPWIGPHLPALYADLFREVRRQKKLHYLLQDIHIRYQNIANNIDNPDQTWGTLEAQLIFEEE